MKGLSLFLYSFTFSFCSWISSTLFSFIFFSFRFCPLALFPYILTAQTPGGTRQNSDAVRLQSVEQDFFKVPFSYIRYNIFFQMYYADWPCTERKPEKQYFNFWNTTIFWWIKKGRSRIFKQLASSYPGPLAYIPKGPEVWGGSKSISLPKDTGGGGHANFGWNPSSSLGSKSEQTDRQTDRQTPLFYIDR